MAKELELILCEIYKNEANFVLNKLEWENVKLFFIPQTCHSPKIAKQVKEKIKKPELEPIEPSVGERSSFAKYIETIPMGASEEHFIDFDNDVKQEQIAENVNLFLCES